MVVKKLYGRCIWDFSPIKKTIYLSFDDGPDPEVTTFVLAELKKYNAKATFFCIGKNVLENSDIYQMVINEGHSIGNHTHDHLNGWKTPGKVYIRNIDKASTYIDSDLFRPPYGKIKHSQIKLLKKLHPESKIIMWSVLSGDFDAGISPAKCLKNVIDNVESGAVVVFHDSKKAFNNLVYTLPLVLEYFSAKGFAFEKIN